MILTKILNRNVILQNLGLQSHAAVMKIMNTIKAEKKSFLRKEIMDEPADQLLICEHKPVYTVGIRKKDYLDLKVIEKLKSLDAEFCYTDRGGLITFHGPGQLVCYPVLNLEHYTPSVRWYICQLEEVLIKTCNEFGIEGVRTENVGIWVGDNKIAAVGVHCRQYITSHGIALNCNADLSWYDHIVPCGLHGKGVTSISKELRMDVTIGQVSSLFIRNFEKKFNCKVVNQNN